MVWSLIFPLFAAFVAGSGSVIEKYILKKKTISPKLYQSFCFFIMAIIMIPLLFFFWKLDSLALNFTNILIMLAVVVFSLIANYFVLYALKWDKLTHIEPARLLEPLFTIILAIIFSFIFGEALFERNTKVIIPAIIAGVALVASHIKKHHLSFDKYFIFAIIGSFFFALELVISRLILDFYSPLTFYFVRCTFIFVFSFILFKPKFKELDKKTGWQIFGAGAIWVILRVMIYYGYIELGVIFTTLVLMLGPIFIYFFAWKFLREKPSKRNLIAAAIILASVLYAVLA